MKRMKAVQSFFKRRLIDNLIQVEECKAIAQVRRDMKRDETERVLRRIPEACICFEG